MSRRRRRGSFSRQRRSSRWIGPGRSFGSRSHSISRIITAAITSEAVSPVKARCPPSISYSTMPNAQMSARRSAGLPFACSGLM